MNPLSQMIHGTKPITSNNSLKEPIKDKKVEVESEMSFRDELNNFLENIAVAKTMGAPGISPEIEASRKIVELYNKANLKGFDDVGYFLFEGVKVFESGRADEAKKKEAVTTEERNFGNK